MARDHQKSQYVSAKNGVGVVIHRGRFEENEQPMCITNEGEGDVQMKMIGTKEMGSNQELTGEKGM